MRTLPRNIRKKRTATTLAALTLLLLATTLTLSGCKDISLKDGYYSCVPDFRGSCPPGMTCHELGFPGGELGCTARFSTA